MNDTLFDREEKIYDYNMPLFFNDEIKPPKSLNDKLRENGFGNTGKIMAEYDLIMQKKSNQSKSVRDMIVKFVERRNKNKE